MERPIQFRYTEIEAFPTTLNDSQRVNWMTRIFIADARTNLSSIPPPSSDDTEPQKLLPYTEAEIDALERSLIEHETWLNEWVSKQRSVATYDDPVIFTTEMKARAKALEGSLGRLARRKAVTRKSTSSSTYSTTSAKTEENTTQSTSSTTLAEESSTPVAQHDEL